MPKQQYFKKIFFSKLSFKYYIGLLFYNGYNGYYDRAVLVREMKRGMTIEYLKCRADLNFEVDFEVNGAIGTIVTKWDLMVFG